MCLWLLTACLGLLPANPSPTIVVVPAGVPSPILLPTAAPVTTTTTTTARPAPPTNMTGAPPASSVAPTMAPPTVAPTAAPTAASMAPPTPAPTAAPTAAPTMAPTAAPTVTPTAAPTMAPTAAPTMAPTAAPTMAPTAAPTMAPTAAPTMAPTAAPTMAPTAAPTMAPTAAPTAPPTPAPTAAPTMAATTTSNLGGVTLTVVLCNDPDVVCISNPDDETASGSPAIDPRLGTTPAPSAALQVPPINGYNVQDSSYDTAVKFPREKRNTDVQMRVKTYLTSLFKRTGKDEHHIRKRQANCVCVAAGTCPTNGAGMLDVRIVTPGATATQCPTGQVYCCGVATTIGCGLRQTVPATAVVPSAGQATFGEFPWQAIVLTKQNDYLAGGVLIDQLNVLTVTHRLVNYVVTGTAPNLKVRLGEWDAAATTEPIPFQEYSVAKVFTHPMYNPTTLQYDLTVLRLSAPVPLTPAAGAATTINRACLPPTATTTYTGQRCWVSGWGKNMFGMQGLYQQILKKVEVPIVAPATCQSQLQAARLGASYVLDTTSFVCAGGEASKDSCTGDGGSGLVCNVTGQWVVVGLVSWGLGCAMANVPAAYVNVAALLPWIQQQVATA